MRRNGGLWMVTFAAHDCDENDCPAYYEELPVYYRTRRAALYGAAEENAYGERHATVVVRPAPDDVHESDIAWEDE